MGRGRYRGRIEEPEDRLVKIGWMFLFQIKAVYSVKEIRNYRASIKPEMFSHALAHTLRITFTGSHTDTHTRTTAMPLICDWSRSFPSFSVGMRVEAVVAVV